MKIQILIILFFASFINAQTDLIAHYPFNGNANDESGNGNHGDTTGHAPTITYDRFGNDSSAYSFDGIDDYIRIPYDPSLQPTEQLTVSVFANLSEYSSYQALVSNHAPGGWAIWVMQDSVGIDIQFPAADDRIGVKYSMANIPVNSWFNVAGVYDGSSICLYINGELKTETPFTGPISYLYQNDVHIGAHVNLGYYPTVDGIIDDIYLYNRGLSSQEVDSLYHVNGWDIHETGTVTDIDGNEYQTVKIGDQWWMAENLKVTHYRDGTAIPTGYSNSEWANLSTGAYCTYNNNPDYGDIYGNLYNWFAAMDTHSIAPEGWRIPTDEEWKQLEVYLGMSQSQADSTGFRGTDEGGKLKETGTTYWSYPNTGATNESGFKAIATGYRHYTGYFNHFGNYTWYWSATENNNTTAWDRELSYNNSTIFRGGYPKTLGYSIRCIKNTDNLYTVSLGNADVSQIDTTSVPVNILGTQGVNINSFELTLNKGSGDLLFMEIDTINTLISGAGWMYALNETDTTILFAAAGSDEITMDGTLLNLRYAPMGEPCNTYPVEIRSCIVNTGIDSLTLVNGSVTILPVPVFGDVDENLSIQAYDAAMILKHIVGSDTLACQGVANADVSLNDTISALDASVILQYVVDSIDTLPYSEPLLATGEVSVREIFASGNQLINIPIDITNGTNLYSIQGVISLFDEPDLLYEDISFFGLSNNAIQTKFTGNQLRFAYASAEPISIEGEIGNIQFMTTSDFDGSSFSIDELRLNENMLYENITVEVALGISTGGALPTEYALKQNYPNPFNPTTILHYDLPNESNVRIVVYDIMGHEITELVDRQLPAGKHTAVWNGKNISGIDVPTGMYFAKMMTADYSRTIKMVLMK